MTNDTEPTNDPATGSALTPCAGVLLVERDKVLLARRHPDRDWYPNVWDVIGGHRRRNETASTAACREAHEEVGVSIDEDTLVHIATLTGADYELELFATTTWTGEPRNCAPEEHIELAWFKPSDTAELALADRAITHLATTAIARTTRS